MDKLKKVTIAVKAISDENRIRIVSLLYSRKDVCVCEITAIIGLSQPTISSHLKLLESAGLIEHKKDGLWVNYSINPQMDPGIKDALDRIMKAIASSKTIKDDKAKLSQVDRSKLCSRDKSL